MSSTLPRTKNMVSEKSAEFFCINMIVRVHCTVHCTVNNVPQNNLYLRVEIKPVTTVADAMVSFFYHNCRGCDGEFFITNVADATVSFLSRL